LALGSGFQAGFTTTEGNAQKNDPMEKPGDEAPG
jgi:hypothetical protein